MSETTHDLGAKYLVDPYLNWARAEGVPIVEGETLDLLAVETKAWARFGMRGAICHVEGRCDFLSAFLFELAPGQSSEPSRHLYEDCYYVLEGEGVSEIELSNGARHAIPWGPGVVFTTPVNATCRLRVDGASRARLLSLNDMRYLMGLYRNEAFLFHNSAPMGARQAKALETSLRVDLAGLNGGAALQLGDSAIGADYIRLAPGVRTQAQRQMQGAHLLCARGEATIISCLDETSERITTRLREGCLTGLTGMMFHQQSNSGAGSLGLLKVELGAQASPLFRSRRAAYGDQDVYASGSAILAGI
jgi:mannose-6-phosphate isomerase-like protein (cupin superfamily)